MKDYKTLRIEVCERFSDYRSIEHLINQSNFEDAYKTASDADKFTIEFLAASGNVEKLKEWVKNNKPNLGIRALQEKAKKLRIKNVSRASKLELEDAIEQAERHLEIARNKSDINSAV